MSKYDGLSESDCRQLLAAKLEMLVRWAKSDGPLARFDDLDAKQYLGVLDDAAELVGHLNRIFNSSPSSINRAIREAMEAQAQASRQ